MGRDLDKEPQEPVANPFVKQAKPALAPVPPADLPPVYEMPKAKKVVNRYMFSVVVLCEGKAYGPIEQEAVDESEAIQRVLDEGKIGGLDRAKCRFQVTCKETAKRKTDAKSAKAARTAERELVEV